ncbi:MAG: YitT family protein [Spirochaetaceae bacterium]|nr:YitT family protein [Spirochaetaceae bacterium]
MRNSPLGRTARRLALILLGSLLLAIDINTFVRAGELIPGGFTGLTLLIQSFCSRYGGFDVPFSVLIIALNAVPALICYRFIGKKFTLYSCLAVVASGLLTDFIPSMFIDFLLLQDTLLSAVFGGILNAAGITCCLLADATSGGTDFIAIFISERYHKNSWGYIFAGNCVILLVAACLFSLDKVLYSIIFQFATTMVLSRFYGAYQQRTMLIITNKPDEIYHIIRETTNHDATSFRGLGHFSLSERILVYSVVTANQVQGLIAAITRVDPAAFINVLKTETLNGQFYLKPKD